MGKTAELVEHVGLYNSETICDPRSVAGIIFAHEVEFNKSDEGAQEAQGSNNDY